MLSTVFYQAHLNCILSSTFTSRHDPASPGLPCHWFRRRRRRDRRHPEFRRCRHLDQLQFRAHNRTARCESGINPMESIHMTTGQNQKNYIGRRMIKRFSRLGFTVPPQIQFSFDLACSLLRGQVSWTCLYF